MESGEGETNSVGCNEIRLRLGCIISPEQNDVSQEQENEKQPTITPSTVVITEEIEQGGNTVESQDSDKDVTPSPPFPERLMITKPTIYPNFNIAGELKNLYIKIPLPRHTDLCKDNQGAMWEEACQKNKKIHHQ
jgi:hypothetical protein